jgi:hypothetical protein
MQWYLPITVLPGIALIILSTTNLWVSLSEEIERLESIYKDEMKGIINRKIRQLSLLNIAMMMEYLSALLMVFAGMVSGWIQIIASENTAEKWTIWLTIVSVVALSIALVLLVNYSIKALAIRKKQFELACK